MRTRLLIAAAACAMAVGITAPSFGAAPNEGDSAVTGSPETGLSAQVPSTTPEAIIASSSPSAAERDRAVQCSLIDSEQLRVDDGTVPAFCKGYVPAPNL